MKYIIIASLLLSGCTSSTKYGECIGLDGEEIPGKTYKYSVNNILLAVIFGETIIVPYIVLTEEIKCPVN